MNLKRILWKYEPRKDGSCDIKIYIYHLKKQSQISTGFSIQPKDWDDRNGLVKKSHPLADSYNANIRRMQLELEEHLLNGGVVANFRKKKDTITLISYCEKVIDKWEKGLLSMSAGTIKNYKATLRRLKEFHSRFKYTDLAMDQIDMKFYDQFTEFLKMHCNCNLPGISKHIKIIKRLMKMAMDEKLHVNTIFQDASFKRPRTKASGKIYLTTDEIDQLEQLDLSDQPYLQRERDRFLLSYWFLMRFSDVIRVNKAMLFSLNGKRFLRYQSVKTNVETNLPVKEKAMSLMELYGFDFSFSGNVQANRELKTIAAMAGINAPTFQEGRKGPKSSFVTTHTARRSAATNLYLDGVSLKMIADLGGWTDLQSLRTYLRASGLDTAQVAVDLDFFS
ncbi:MAG: site-specific integrase [Saprospiraceae bacterium]|nr:site-specific integrase [Lewinella sp.]